MPSPVSVSVVVTVCTRQRPARLAACLRSLLNQQLPAETSLSVVVVENDDAPHSRPIVEDIASRHGVPVVYAHEPRLGIPMARNRALDLAIELKPDWIGFIDDDEVASADWLATFLSAADTLQCDVMEGPVDYRYSTSAPTWIDRDLERRRRIPTGTRRRSAATSNTLMRARIAEPDGMGLRFNEAMAFTGGEDSEFFHRAADRGAVIRWVDEAVVSSEVPAVRTTVRWQIERCRWVSAVSVYIHRERHGLAAACARYGLKCLLRTLRAPFGLLACALYPLTPTLSKRLMYRALRDLWSGLGGFGGFIGILPQPYRHVIDADSTCIPRNARSYCMGGVAEPTGAANGTIA